MAPRIRQPVLRLATRSSPQARTQAAHVAALIAESSGVEPVLVFVDTAGDRDRTTALTELGGQGIFVKEVQAAVLAGDADVAVHSAKDLPSSWTADGLTIGAIPARRDPRDALVGVPLAELREGATIATGSARRQAILAQRRPDLRFVGLRGNIATRVARADDLEIDAVVVAVTGAEWVGLGHRLVDRLPVEVMVPQVGQGAMALECRSDDPATLAALCGIDDGSTRRAVEAERAFLATLGGGCDLPVGAHAELQADGSLLLRGVLAPDVSGHGLVTGSIIGPGADIGTMLAQRLRSQMNV